MVAQFEHERKTALVELIARHEAEKVPPTDKLEEAEACQEAKDKTVVRQKFESARDELDERGTVVSRSCLEGRD